MIKSLLLKLAYKIYKYYNTIEINDYDIVKYKGVYFAITSTYLSKRIGYCDTLQIELQNVLTEMR